MCQIGSKRLFTRNLFLFSLCGKLSFYSLTWEKTYAQSHFPLCGRDHSPPLIVALIHNFPPVDRGRLIHHLFSRLWERLSLHLPRSGRVSLPSPLPFCGRGSSIPLHEMGGSTSNIPSCYAGIYSQLPSRYAGGD